METEAYQALHNIGQVLKAAGANYTNVVKTTVRLTNIDDLPVVDAIYKYHFFKTNFPARSVFQVYCRNVAAGPRRAQVAALPDGALVEIDAIAVV